MNLREALELAHTLHDKGGFVEAKEDLGKKVWVCVFPFRSPKKRHRVRVINLMVKQNDNIYSVTLGCGKLLGRIYYEGVDNKREFRIILCDFKPIFSGKFDSKDILRTFHSSWMDLGEKWFYEGRKEVVNFT